MTECEPDDEGDDSELEDADPAEDDGLGELSLGSLDHNHSQERWARGGRRDLEQDPAGSGIGDHVGLLEQIGYRDWTQTVMAKEKSLPGSKFPVPPAAPYFQTEH